jgi:hypothetical protein
LSFGALWAAPGTAHAGTYGELDLTWTGTTVNWTEFPGRGEQTTYDPCLGPERIVGVGGYVIESVQTVPTYSEFDLGKAFNVSIHPVDEHAQVPKPDSNRQVAENRLQSNPDSVIMGESTLCSVGDVEPSYRKTKFATPGKSRSSAKAACPGGSHVLSGGAKAPGPFKSQRIAESYPFDGDDANDTPDDGWRVSVDNLKRKNRKASAYAICGDVDDLFYGSVTVPASGQDRAHVGVSCPGGDYSIGGGVKHGVPFKEATLVATRHSLAPAPTGWIVELDNLSADDAQLKTFVVCHA